VIATVIYPNLSSAVAVHYFAVKESPSYNPYVEDRILFYADESHKYLQEAMEKRKRDEELRNRMVQQYKLAQNIARLSPIRPYFYTCAILAKTSLWDHLDFIQKSKEYDEILAAWHKSKNIDWDITDDFDEHFKPKKPDLSDFPWYEYKNTRNIFADLQIMAVDLLILVLFNLIFFTAGYVAFLKYDVR